MKRCTLTIIALLLITTITKAQITKGSVYLGGNIGASTTKLENSNSTIDGKSNSFSITPAIGIAIKNNLITGIDLHYGHGSTKNFSNNQNTRRNSYATGIFLRKYFPVFNHFYVFGESNLHYFTAKYEYLPTPGYTYSYIIKQHSVLASVYPGLSVNVLKSFYLETSFNNLLEISYASSTTEGVSNSTASSSKQKDFTIASSLTNNWSLNVGIRFIIPKK